MLLAAFASAAAQEESCRPQWPNYNNGLDGQRYSTLTQLTPRNISKLRSVCEIILGEVSSFQSGILVIGETLYVTTPHLTVALDALSCRARWRHVYRPTSPEIHPTNRGAAYADGRIYRGTGDGHVLALDARNGRELWRVAAGDSHRGEFFSAAPIVWKDWLYIGTSGGDYGASSRMMALDRITGKEVWRFNLVPTDGEPGADTWSYPEGKTRIGAATWSSYSLDESTSEIFVSTGNPGPALAPDERRGADLYTDAVVVLDARTGKLQWYYQAVPNDGLDYDIGAAAVLYRDAHHRRRLAVAGKDGFLSLVDRESRALVARVAVTTIVNSGVHATVEGIRVCPSVTGAVLWNGPAFDPKRHALYVGSVDQCGMVYAHAGDPKSDAARAFGTMALPPPAGDRASGWVVAVDANDGKVLWKFHADAPVVSAITPTAGGLIFGGTTDGDLFALDAADGRELYRTNTGGMMGGGIVTYALHGRQYLAYTSGGIMRGSFMRHVGQPKVVIAAVGATAPVVRIALPAPRAASGSAETAASRPLRRYAELCALCHGAAGQGIDGPALKGAGTQLDAAQIAEVIEHPGMGMPAYFPDVLDHSEVRELARFIVTWK
jgi:alcohol dehydrogenase (cytochrome c)